MQVDIDRKERRNSTLTPYSKASIHQARSIFPNDFISSHPARYRHRFSQRKNKNWTISNNASRNERKNDLAYPPFTIKFLCF